jgi:dTMP kinase
VFITFEGIEGCGKSTQAARLVRKLRELQKVCVATLEPGGTELGRNLRRILLDPRSVHLDPLAELLLYEADRAQHVKEVIKPALDRGEWVVCDRFADATSAYQGYARNQDIELIRELNGVATLGIRPDLTFLLDCPVSVGLGRAIRRNMDLEKGGEDRFEREVVSFHEAVRRGYLSIAEEEKERVVLLDATLSEDRMGSEIFDHVRPFLDEAGL